MGTAPLPRVKHGKPRECFNSDFFFFFNGKGPNSYAGSTGTLFGTHDAYRDPRERPPKRYSSKPGSQPLCGTVLPRAALGELGSHSRDVVVGSGSRHRAESRQHVSFSMMLMQSLHTVTRLAQ